MYTGRIDTCIHGTDPNSCFDYFRVVIMVNRQLVNEHMEKLQSGKIKRLSLNPDALKWTPLISSQSLLDEEKSTANEVIVNNFCIDIFIWHLILLL